MPYSTDDEIRRPSHLSVGLFSVWISLLLSANSFAQSNQSNKSVEPQKAIATAKKSVKGKVLKIDRQKEHYRVKMLNPQGRVVSVRINRQSGKVMPPKVNPADKPVKQAKTVNNDKE